MFSFISSNGHRYSNVYTRYENITTSSNTEIHAIITLEIKYYCQVLKYMPVGVKVCVKVLSP